MAAPRIVGMCCEWAVRLWDESRLDEQNRLKEMPHVACIKVPCSGMIKAAWGEMALKNGAAGWFSLGCPIGDCHFREGNLFCEERFFGTMTPRLKPAVDKDRVRTFYFAAGQHQQFIAALEEFTELLRAKAAAEEAQDRAVPPEATAPVETAGEAHDGD